MKHLVTFYCLIVKNIVYLERENMTRLFRSEQNKKIAGVCGGIGEFFDIDPTLIRLVFIFLGLATGLVPFIIGYIIAWWIVPTKSEIEK